MQQLTLDRECSHVDLLAPCTALAVATITDHSGRHPDGWPYCPEHAVIALCEQHSAAIKGARLIVDAVRERP